MECGARQVQQGWHPAHPAQASLCRDRLLLQLLLRPSSGFLAGLECCLPSPSPPSIPFFPKPWSAPSQWWSHLLEEEEEGLNIINCAVIVSTQLIKLSAEGSCWLFSTFPHVLFLLQGLEDGLRCWRTLRDQWCCCCWALCSVTSARVWNWCISETRCWRSEAHCVHPSATSAPFLAFPCVVPWLNSGCSSFLPDSPPGTSHPPTFRRSGSSFPELWISRSAPNHEILSPSEYKMFLQQCQVSLRDLTLIISIP